MLDDAVRPKLIKPLTERELNRRALLDAAKDCGAGDLPTLPQLVVAHGFAKLSQSEMKNVRFVSPFGCVCCDRFVFRVGGSCVHCSADYAAPPAPPDEKASAPPAPE